MAIVYIGAFPTYVAGGVTNKNRDLYDALLKEGVPMKKIDLHRIVKGKSIIELLRLLYAIMNPSNKFVIGVSTGKNTRKIFSHLLYCLNKRAMKKSIIMIMGGIDDKNIVADMDYKNYMSCYKKVYVETAEMKKNLETAGMKNIDIYPNCRFKPNKNFNKTKNNQKLNCVFFSLIQPQKGVDLILDVAEKLFDVQFFFYGRIDKSYTNVFLAKSIN